jgi:glucokinase
MEEDYYFGLDVGGTKCAVVLATSQGNIIQKQQFLTRKYGNGNPNQIIEKLLQTIQLTMKASELTRKNIKAIGISCGGPLDTGEGLILSPPNLPDWYRVPIVRIIREKTGVPTYLENDANASALAEYTWGAGKGHHNMVFLTFGTGLGAGIIIGGNLYSGACDMAGEVGHIRLSPYGPTGHGKAGSFEGFCSGGGITQIAYTEIMKRFQAGANVGFCPSRQKARAITARDVYNGAEDGDPVALEIFKITGHYLGKGIAILIDILNPERIILGSIYVRCKRFLEQHIQETVREEALHRSLEVCKIVPAALGERLGDFAALSVAMTKAEKGD